MMEYRTSPTNEYPVRIPESLAGSVRESTVQPTPLRNLHKDFLEISEEMQVYVRIKPSKEDGNVLSIQDNYVVVQPPRDSASFKNKNNAGTKTLQKFKFNKIYDSSVTQEKLFKDSALNLVQDFLLGKNTLLFTYGATSAGKTYTMLGSIREVGLLPRSLDVVFNSLEERLLKNPLLKPLALNEVVRLNSQQTDTEELERSLLMRGFDLDCSDSKDSISTVSSCSIKDWNIRSRETTVCSLQFPKDYYSVWVSYCEIYNEQAFDLLESCDRKKKRTPLRITEDRKGKFYVKGLKEICVRTADDAVRVLLFGKENLHFAATKLNHNSSRSHCVFTIKVIRTNDPEEPTEAAINMMSFVDLAGMERTNKTQSRGERLKEAGNINTSLLILGRCIDAMRMNQMNPQNKNMIPYRESKLTRILQTFFSGQGRAAMYVNVSPSPILCDETLHVLKFGALAQEVVMQQENSIADMSISQFAPPVKPSRFQQYVRKSISLLNARASVVEQATFQIVEEEDANDRIRELEEELYRMKSEWEENEQKIREEVCNEWTEVYSRKEQTWQERYDDLKARYEEFAENRVELVTDLMNSRYKKKRRMVDNEDLEDFALELKNKDDRIEMLEESNSRLTELVEKLKNTLKISEEGKADLQHEMTRLQFEMANLKKPQINFCGSEIDDHDEIQTDDLVKRLEAKLRSKEDMLNEAVLEFHSKSEELTKIQVENDSLKLQNAKSLEEIRNLQVQLERSNLLLTDANDRLDTREEELMTLEDKVAKASSQYSQLHCELREARRRIKELETELEKQTNAKAAVALEDSQIEELAQLREECEALKLKHYQALEKVENLQDELKRSEQSLTEANERLEIREEELMNLEQQVNKANGQHCHLNTELREARRKIRDLEARLNDQSNASAISNMCDDLQRQLLEADTKVERKEEIIQELKAKVDHYQRLAADKQDSSEAVETLRERLCKSQLQLDIAQKELVSLKTTNEDIKARRESLLDQLSHLKKDIELSNAERKSSETDQAELREENEKLHKAVDQMSQIQMQLLEENEDFRNTMGEYETTIEQLTKQMDALKSAQRNSGLLEEELKTLAASLGRLQLEKNQMEREVTSTKSEGEKLRENIKLLEEQNAALKQKYDESQEKVLSLEEEQKSSNEAFKNSRGLTDDVAAKITNLELEVRKYREQAESVAKESGAKAEELRNCQAKYDELERSYEKLNKEMLRHMMRAEELTETIKGMQDDLNAKNKKCDSFSRKVSELESQVAEFKSMQNLLVEKEIALREHEDETKTIQDKLKENESVLEQVKRENARILQEKNVDIARLESELKLLLSGHVDYKTVNPAIKVEKIVEDELEEDLHPIQATPTPVKTRKGRSKKAPSPEVEVDENKPEISIGSSSTRSRRTVKTDFAAPSSTSKTPARKSRKAKSEIEESIHPALALHSEDSETVEPNPSSTSKRRLYNARCPDVLLPPKKEEIESVEFPKRMATRSRKQ